MKFIDLNEQHKLISENINNRFDKIFNHGQYIMGPEVYELEQSLISYVGIKALYFLLFRNRCSVNYFNVSKLWS